MPVGSITTTETVSVERVVTVEQVERCRILVADYETRYRTLVEELAALQNSVAVLRKAVGELGSREYEPGSDSYWQWRNQRDRYYGTIGNQMWRIREITTVEYSTAQSNLRWQRRYCHDLAIRLAAQRRDPPGRQNASRLLRDIRLSSNRIDCRILAVDRTVADATRRDAALRRWLAERGVTPPQTFRYLALPRFELSADLGGNFDLNSPRLDNFG